MSKTLSYSTKTRSWLVATALDERGNVATNRRKCIQAQSMNGMNVIQSARVVI